MGKCALMGERVKNIERKQWMIMDSKDSRERIYGLKAKLLFRNREMMSLFS